MQTQPNLFQVLLREALWVLSGLSPPTLPDPGLELSTAELWPWGASLPSPPSNSCPLILPNQEEGQTQDVLDSHT